MDKLVDEDGEYCRLTRNERRVLQRELNMMGYSYLGGEKPSLKERRRIREIQALLSSDVGMWERISRAR